MLQNSFGSFFICWNYIIQGFSFSKWFESLTRVFSELLQCLMERKEGDGRRVLLDIRNKECAEFHWVGFWSGYRIETQLYHWTVLSTWQASTWSLRACFWWCRMEIKTGSQSCYDSHRCDWAQSWTQDWHSRQFVALCSLSPAPFPSSFLSKNVRRI